MTQQTYVADRRRFRWAARPPEYSGRHRAEPYLIQLIRWYLAAQMVACDHPRRGRAA